MYVYTLTNIKKLHMYYIRFIYIYIKYTCTVSLSLSLSLNEEVNILARATRAENGDFQLQRLVEKDERTSIRWHSFHLPSLSRGYKGWWTHVPLVVELVLQKVAYVFVCMCLCIYIYKCMSICLFCSANMYACEVVYTYTYIHIDLLIYIYVYFLKVDIYNYVYDVYALFFSCILTCKYVLMRLSPCATGRRYSGYSLLHCPVGARWSEWKQGSGLEKTAFGYSTSRNPWKWYPPRPKKERI